MPSDSSTRSRRSRGPAARGREDAQVRGAAHQHELEHREGEVAGVALRHVADAARDLARGTSARARSPSTRLLRHARGEKAEHACGTAWSCRRRSGRARTSLRRRRARSSRRGPRCGRGKPKARSFDAPAYQLLRARANSHRKNGVPMSAVSTPGGTSMVAMVRHSVSTASRNAAPSSMASGSSRPKSGPTSRRAACGIRSPTQPMMPLTATAAAVISVAAATTTSVRSLRVSTPSARASSSGSASRFMRQRRSSMRREAEQRERRRGAEVARRDRGEAAEQPVGDRGKLVVRVGEVLEQRDHRAEQRADHDARLAPARAADRGRAAASRSSTPGRRARRPPAKARSWIEEHVEREEDAEYRAERRAGRDAEDVGRNQRVAEHSLVGGACRGERCADDQRRQHARPAHLQHHRFDIRREACLPLP